MGHFDLCNRFSQILSDLRTPPPAHLLLKGNPHLLWNKFPFLRIVELFERPLKILQKETYLDKRMYFIHREHQGWLFLAFIQGILSVEVGPLVNRVGECIGHPLGHLRHGVGLRGTEHAQQLDDEGLNVRQRILSRWQGLVNLLLHLKR